MKTEAIPQLVPCRSPTRLAICRLSHEQTMVVPSHSSHVSIALAAHGWARSRRSRSRYCGSERSLPHAANVSTSRACRSAALAIRTLNGLVSFARRKPLGAICAVILLGFIFVAAFGPAIAPYGYNTHHPGLQLQGPNSRFWMGTDQYGRDVFTRILYGARVSITVGLCSVGIGSTGGTIIGIYSGYRGGKFDLYLQRFIDGWQSFPSLVVLLALVSVLGPSLINVLLTIGLSRMPGLSRLVRGTVLSVKQNDYVLAARSLGANNSRILVQHILPNVAAPIIVSSAIALGGAIIAESSLSFLGLGVPPPNPTWGGMLSGDGRRYMLIQPWLGLWPGLAIMIAVMSFNLFGDALRDVWDPRLRGGK